MKTSFPTKPRSVLLTLLLALAVVLAGCGGAIPQTGDDANSSTVDLNVTGSSIEAPQEVSSGIVTFNLSNANQAPYDVTLTRLNPDVSLEQFMSTLAEDDEAAISLVSMVGGRDALPGEVTQLTADLDPGTYVAVGFPAIEGEEAPPITGSFTVSGDQPSPAAEPAADVTVDMVDFAFSMPDTIPAGEQTWEITNSGTQWHHMVILQLDEGVTEEDLMQMMQSEEEPEGPPPFEQVAYFGPSTQGERAWMDVDLQPGTYTAICFLPDFNTGQAHVELGMIKTFEVTQ